MEIEIIIMSFVIYLILFNSCLTFRLKFINNLVIIAILAFNILVIGKLIGDLAVVPMFLSTILYICYLKKEDWKWNIFLIIVSYILLVIVDNIVHLVYVIAELDTNRYWWVYALTVYPIAFFICRFISKKVVQIKEKEILPLSPKILRILGADLILCMLIFVIHIAIVEQAGSSPRILLSSITLYISYIILNFLMGVTIIKEYRTNADIMLKQNSYDNLREYMTQIEEQYQNIRAFRHDYTNIMASMSGYIEKQDMEGLKKYYDKQIFPISNLLNKEKAVVAKLHNLKNIELKSLISMKVNYALEMKIEVNIEIIEPIETINMRSVDLVRIIGILLDNGIEACQECEQPSLCLSIIKMNQDVTFIVKNTYIKKDIDYSKLGTLGISSKGTRRGTGLYNIKTITNTYDNVIMDTEYDDEHFTQLLEIYG